MIYFYVHMIIGIKFKKSYPSTRSMYIMGKTAFNFSIHEINSLSFVCCLVT